MSLVLSMVSVDMFKADTNEVIVVLDPGHDSKHSGAGSYGLREEELNLKIATYCYQELSQYAGVKVYMTHDTLACPNPGTNSRDDNINRIRYAKSVDADVVVSLHNNSIDKPSVQGLLIYYPNQSYHPEHYTLGKGLAQSIQGELAALGIKDRGIEYKNTQDNSKYPDGSLADYYRVINEGKLQDVPTIIVEHVFMSNWSDVQNYLSSDEKLRALGVADATGIAEYFGLQKKDDPSAFNARYYADRYSDLKAVFGYDENALYTHFVNFGINEGRRASAAFDVYSYRGRYADLQNVFGTDLKGYYTHYMNCGITEGRDGRPIDQAYTVRFMQGNDVISTQVVGFGQSANTSVLSREGAEWKLNKSVSCITSDMDVQVSYTYMYEGTDYGPVFDAEYYLNTYADLRNAFGTNAQAALGHFISFGMREGRSGNVTFDVYSYRGRYGDLQDAFGTDLKAYYTHYLNFGITEGRDGTYTNQICIYNGVNYAPIFDAEYYLNTYADLRNAFGTNRQAALEHFMFFGMGEGRRASATFDVNLYRSRYSDLQNAFGNDLKSYYTHYLNYGIQEGRSAK